MCCYVKKIDFLDFIKNKQPHIAKFIHMKKIITSLPPPPPPPPKKNPGYTPAKRPLQGCSSTIGNSI